MLKYLVVMLSDKSLSYCHYDNDNNQNQLIDLEYLRQAIKFGMRQNLMIQFIYPEDPIPPEYETVIETIDHIKYKSILSAKSEDIGIAEKWPEDNDDVHTDNVIIRRTVSELITDMSSIEKCAKRFSRINVVIKDIDSISGQVEGEYKNWIKCLSSLVSGLYNEGFHPQINILTDRVMLDNPNHCEAGVKSVTVAPDGKFYICPAFYYSGMDNIGTLLNGLNIRNSQLLELERSPVCKICDAYHCKRCLWLNKSLTQEINIPGRQQCVAAHIEREGSRLFLNSVKDGTLIASKIPELEYDDPFDKLMELL